MSQSPNDQTNECNDSPSLVECNEFVAIASPSQEKESDADISQPPTDRPKREQPIWEASQSRHLARRRPNINGLPLRHIQSMPMLTRFMTINCSDEPLRFEANLAVHGGRVGEGEDMFKRKRDEEAWEETKAVTDGFGVHKLKRWKHNGRGIGEGSKK